MSRIRTMMAAFVLALMPVVSLAATLGEAVKAYESGAHDKAAGMFESLAAQGNTRAQVYLGIMYFNGQGVKESNQQAHKWFKKAADAGDPDGLFQLGYMYNYGFGIGPDVVAPERMAVSLYKKAADKGHAEAQYNLGLMMIYGSGIEPDFDAGMAMIRKAADAGLKEAQEFLASQ